MAAKLSTEVTSRLRSCLSVLSALWQQGSEVASQVLEILQPNLQTQGRPVKVALRSSSSKTSTLTTGGVTVSSTGR